MEFKWIVSRSARTTKTQTLLYMYVQCESKKSPLRGPNISHFSQKTVENF